MAHRWVPSLALACLLAGSVEAATISFQGADNESFSYDGTFSEDVIRFDLPNMAQPAGEYAWLIFEGIGPGAIPMGAVVLSATLEGWVDNPFGPMDNPGSATVARLLEAIADRPMSPARLDDTGVAGTFYEDDQLISAPGPGCISSSVCDPPVKISWNVTAIVQAWLGGEDNYGFLILPETTNAGGLAGTDSLDTSLRPSLVIEFMPLPEPEAGGLLGVGLAASVALGRLRSGSRTAS